MQRIKQTPWVTSRLGELNRILSQTSINKSSSWKSVSDLRVNTDLKIILKNILLEDYTDKYLELIPL